MKKLISAGELRIVEDEVDVDLEIAHIAYLEVKKPNGGKALLFTNPINKARNYRYKMSVLINLYGSHKRMSIIFGTDVNTVSKNLQILLKPKTNGLMEKIALLKKIFALRSVVPKRQKNKALWMQRDIASLDDLPILKTWSKDGGAFITMGQVFMRGLDGKDNVGMYRLQVHDSKTLGMHFQIHKDAHAIFKDYQEQNKKIPVSVAIGGDALYTWCATAPLPKGIFELLLYGFVRKKRAKLIACDNGIFVPFDSDIIIEGYIDPSELKDEGPFGDHTGVYTQIEPYPIMRVQRIRAKKDPIFVATVVGKPPIEDKYMGYPTERIFLSLLQTVVPDLIDYRLPENGVFHNAIICKIHTRYPGHSKQVMHALWGVGQMSFVKNAIFVGKDAPDLEDDDAIMRHILQRIDKKSFDVSSGLIDALDHASFVPLVGGKLGIDATSDKPFSRSTQNLSDEKLLEVCKNFSQDVLEVRQFYTDCAFGICAIRVKKTFRVRDLFAHLRPRTDYLDGVFVVDDDCLDNPYMLFWRITNNFDASSDLFTDGFLGFDATAKTLIHDNFDRPWPQDTLCDENVLKDLAQRDLIDFDDEFIKRWQIL